MKSTIELFRDVICLNEGGESVALCFSDPDGVRSGKSGWSFGVCQFDLANNSLAAACLSECGFTHDEIEGLTNQVIDPKPLNPKLAAHADIILKYDEAQLQHCLDSAERFISLYDLPPVSTPVLLALADTVNQYGSLGNGSASFLRQLGRPAVADDILTMKLGWKYSKTKHGMEDTKRRHNNLMLVLGRNNAA